MKPTTRSISGAVLMLAIIPAIIGILACMPVPIGNPERSRIDPEISGVWVGWMLDSEDATFYAFEPYDKRTWLLTSILLEEGERADFSDYDLESADDVVRLMESESIGDDGATATEIGIFKVWRTKLGGEWFMTWEPKAVFGESNFKPEVWFVFRIVWLDANTLDLYMVGGDLSLFDGVKGNRRAFERVIKKNARNPELYVDEPTRLIRVQPEHLEFFGELAGKVIEKQDAEPWQCTHTSIPSTG